MIYQSDIKVLTKITTPDAIIDFNLENREDINLSNLDNLKRLKSIDITSIITNQKIKSFELGYSYFPYNQTGTLSNNGITDPFITSHIDTFGKRLKLDSLKEIGYDNNGIAVTTKPAYMFEYDLSNTMPLKCSFAKDLWGYYNGENNNKLLPDLGYFDYPNKYFNANFALFNYNYVGANRYTNNAYAGAYMLKKIIYPTRGFSEFEYEPNSFTNQFIPDKVKLDMAYKLNLLQDKNYSGDLTSKTFTLSRATTITFDNTIYGGYIYNMATGYNYAQMTGSYIELLKVNMTGGSPVVTSLKKWDLSTVLNLDFTANNGKQWIEEVRVEYDSNPNVYYTVNVSLPNNLVNNSYGSVSVKTRFYYYDDTGVDTSISNQCGMRVKSVKNYAQNGTITNNKILKYYEGKLLNKFEPIQILEVLCFNCNIIPGVPCPTASEFKLNKLFISTDNLIREGGNLIGYGKIEETEIANNDNTNNIGKRTFTFSNIENLSSSGFPVVPNLKNGIPIKEFQYDKSGTLLSEKGYSYLDLNNGINCYYSINIIKNFIGNKDSMGAVGTPYADSKHKYSYYATPLISEWNKLQSTQTNQFFSGKTLTTTEVYTYNNQGKTSTATSTNSNNEQLITKQYYSNDAIAYNLAMSAAKMTGIPIYTEQYKGNELLSTQKTEYTKDDADKATTNNLILPKRVFASKGINTLEKRVTYDQYDNKGNLLQYTLENGTSVAIIWGFNQTLPIAKIENATYSQANAVYSTTNDTSFRNSLPNAMITTYTYKPLIGVSTITDAKGDKITYSYDAFGRLLNAKDKDGNILSENEYHYKN